MNETTEETAAKELRERAAVALREAFAALFDLCKTGESDGNDASALDHAGVALRCLGQNTDEIADELEAQ